MFKNEITPIPNDISPTSSEIPPIDDQNTPKFRSFLTSNLKNEQLFKQN